MFKNSIGPFAVGAVFAVVVAGGAAYAATGGDLILGKYNQAGATTTLKSTNGAALKLQASGSPVLKVSNGKRIAKLNADKLDGIHAEGFWKKTDTLPIPVPGTGHVTATGIAADLNGNGVPDAVIAVATCPAGSFLTGGGGTDSSSTGYLISTAPTSDNRSWLFAIGITEFSGDGTGSATSYAMCLGPNGKPVGTLRTSAKPSAADLDLLRQAVRARR